MRALDRWLLHPILKPIGLFLVIFGCKLWLIHSSAVSCPFWDDWDINARTLALPWLEHRLGWLQLLSPHNEHRLFMTRLLDLGLLICNRLWEPKLQMIAGAFVHTMTAVLIYRWFRKIFEPEWMEYLWLLLVLAVFALPLGYENALWSSQSQMYFLMLFSTISVRLFSCHEPLTKRWFLGILFAAAAYFSLASGILSVIAVGLALLVQAAAIRSLALRQGVSLIVCCALVIFGVYFIPSTGGHIEMNSSSIFLLLSFFLKMLSGPNFRESWPALMIWFPFAAFFVRRVLQKKEVSDEERFLLGYGFFILLQTAALAYGRASPNGIASRYYDLLLPGILVNFIAIAKLLKSDLGNFRHGLILVSVMWSWLCLFGFWNETNHQIEHGIKPRKETGLIQQSNVKSYLATGDFGFLQDKPRTHIPYGSAPPLKEFLDQPLIRNILSSSIRTPLKGEMLGQSGDSFRDIADGAFGKKKEKFQGKIIVKYQNNGGFHWVRIPVAGDPLREGQSLRLRAKSGAESRLYYLSKNPGDQWSSAYARVPENEFSIEAEDASEKYRFAFRNPIEEGNLCMFAEFLLKSWKEFVRPGLILLLFPFLYRIFRDSWKLERS